MSRNPFKKVATILGVIGTIFLVLIAIAWLGLMIYAAVDTYTWHVLWQAPLTFATCFAIIYALYWIGRGIGKVWNYFSDRWDRKHGV